VYTKERTEPVVVIVYGAQESIPRNRLRHPMWLGGPVRKLGLSYWPARLGIVYWAPQMVSNTGSRFPSLKTGGLVEENFVGVKSFITKDTGTSLSCFHTV
jgi:hypothetical protein